MINIKQKLFKFTISFICLFSISSCDQRTNSSSMQNNTNSVVNIAILLPITGAEASLSKEYAQIIKIGLSDSAKSKIRVTTYDSADDKKLSQSLDKIFEEGTDIIIGPIYSGDTQIVSDKVKGKGTIVLSLSNNPILANKQVFVYGHAPMRQLEQITNYFLENNYQNYIALLPSGQYSSTIGEILRDTITSKDAKLAIEFYDNEPDSIEKAVKIVSNKVDNLNENDFNLTQPVILLSDDPATLGTLYSKALHYNLDKKAIIAGDSRIDIDSSFPVDVTFTGSMDIINANFTMRTAKAGIKHISFMHALAYDAGKMAGKYIGSHYNRTQFLEKMNSSEPFIGVSGKIHFIDSIAQRKYDIIKKENSQYKAISRESQNGQPPR